MSQKIRKLKSNSYILADTIWVRDFTKSSYIDINNLSNEKDHNIFLNNEIENYNRRLKLIDQDTYFHNNIVIVSNGYGFIEKHKILAKLPKDKVAIIAINGTLAKWRLLGKDCPPELRRPINWYVVNNPYPECIKFLPTQHRYFPRCIASTRTNPNFIKKYNGDVNLYVPTPSKEYSGPFSAQYKIDDYRNPICAAIDLAYRFRANKILLFCCDDSFEDSRPYAEKLENGLYSYPQQQLSRKIIDAKLYWLQEENIQVADYSSGIKLQHSLYINNEQDILGFFEES